VSFARTVLDSRRKRRLVSVLFELTYACNLDCTFCYNDRALKGRPLSLPQYRALLEELASMNVLDVVLSGGEPLAHPDFFEIGALTRELGFVVRLKSNGHAIGEATAARIKREIEPVLVETSVHGATAQTHDRQTRVPGSFERLVRNIGFMRAAGLAVRANVPLTRWNEHEVEPMLDLADALDIRMRIDPETKARDDGDRSPLALAPSRDGLARLHEVVTRRARSRAAVSVGSESHDQGSALVGDVHCGAGVTTLTIDPVGNVLPCVQWRQPVGNLHATSIAQIWRESEELEHVRRQNARTRELLKDLGAAEKPESFCPGEAFLLAGRTTAVDAVLRARDGKRHLPVAV
jgi:MoaA/NifB/PqqE/SkfB family radical SAM enzyme